MQQFFFPRVFFIRLIRKHFSSAVYLCLPNLSISVFHYSKQDRIVFLKVFVKGRKRACTLLSYRGKCFALLGHQLAEMHWHRLKQTLTENPLFVEAAAERSRAWSHCFHRVNPLTLLFLQSIFLEFLGQATRLHHWDPGWSACRLWQHCSMGLRDPLWQCWEWSCGLGQTISQTTDDAIRTFLVFLF